MSDESTSHDSVGDFKSRFKAFAQPLVDTVDSKLRAQVEDRVDERVDQALSARLAVIERAIADLDRSVKELQQRLDHTSD